MVVITNRSFGGYVNAGTEIQIKIAEDVVRLIESEARSSARIETGGVVAGLGVVGKDDVVVTHASGPGPLARRSGSYFQHDRSFCQNFLDSLAARSNGRIDYLGEWHKHFERDPKPSGTDVRTLKKIALAKNYHVSLPLLFIIGGSNERDSLKAWTIDGAGRIDRIEWTISGDAQTILCTQQAEIDS